MTAHPLVGIGGRTTQVTGSGRGIGLAPARRPEPLVKVLLDFAE
ncbi:hypothetical protein [Streptomyces sp. NPDC020362]